MPQETNHCDNKSLTFHWSNKSSCTKRYVGSNATPQSNQMSLCSNDQTHDLSQKHDGSPPHHCNISSFCKDDFIEWADCTMHNPATGSQTAKDFDAMHKSAKPSKPCESSSSAKCSASPPHRECNSHSSYYAIDIHCSAKHSRSRSCSHSCSRGHDCHNDDCRSQRSSHPYHDDYIGHHDFTTNPPEALYDCKLKKYCHADNQTVTHGYRLGKNLSDFLT